MKTFKIIYKSILLTLYILLFKYIKYTLICMSQKNFMVVKLNKYIKYTPTHTHTHMYVSGRFYGCKTKYFIFFVETFVKLFFLIM